MNPFVNGQQQEPKVREGLVRVITGSIEFSSHGDADMIKITDEVRSGRRQTGLRRRHRHPVRPRRDRRR